LLLSGEGVGCAITLIVIGIVVAIYFRSQAEEARKRREAEEEYQASLSEAEGNYRRMLGILRSNPSDPAMREKALSWGRRFAELTRQAVGSGVTIYDEVALSNDINAACAGANRANQVAAPRESSDSIPIEERLAKLKTLLDKDLISSEEYKEKRMRLLDEV
jgi:hypothetical protein